MESFIIYGKLFNKAKSTFACFCLRLFSREILCLINNCDLIKPKLSWSVRGATA